MGRCELHSLCELNESCELETQKFKLKPNLRVGVPFVLKKLFYYKLFLFVIEHTLKFAASISASRSNILV